jgi:hypothetical protein
MSRSERARRTAKLVLGNIVALLVLLVLLEGASGYAFLGYRLLSDQPPEPERVHSEYDSEIGWINRKNVHIADRWGPGAHLTTNSQRFRELVDADPEVPPGRTRVVCSGDSFTFGIGVGDEDTWCHRLATLDDRIETVNWGTGGWGIDQAYLWYRRNEGTYRHAVHLFAFITDDFRRVALDSFRGYGKPYLRLKDGALVQENYPVSESGYSLPTLVRAVQTLSVLRSVDLLNRVSRRISDGGNSDEQTRAVVSRIFEELDRVNQADDRHLVVVYLPVFDDYVRDTRWGDTEVWREFVHQEAEKYGYLLIDVVEEQRKVPFDSIRGQYRVDSDWHYSVEGHRRVADIVYRKLTEFRRVAARLSVTRTGTKQGATAGVARETRSVAQSSSARGSVP